MFLSLAHFINTWQYETASTVKLFSSLTNESLHQSLGPQVRTLRRLANHIVETIPEMAHAAGLGMEEEKYDISDVNQLIRTYEVQAMRLAEKVNTQWTDASLAEDVPMYGETWKKGFVLWVLVMHQVHHRSQMTVLMRMQGLAVPGLYGPSREEWVAMGMQPME
jgi:uncharacterized damage-inducible protein DinB